MKSYLQDELYDYELVRFTGSFGYVAKVGTLKIPNGYGINWSTQLNLRTPIVADGMFTTMFAAKWSTIN